MATLLLGNTAPKEVHRDDAGVETHVELGELGDTVTIFSIPPEMPILEAAKNVCDAFAGPDMDDLENPETGYHSNAGAAWVDGDPELSGLIQVIADQYGCKVGRPKSWPTPDEVV